MKFLVSLIGFLMYPFSFLVPRNKKKWAFGSFRNAFSDNSKYLFIYCSENRKDIDAAWISASKETVKLVRSLGLKAYFIGSFQGICFALRAKYWFFNAYTSDILFFASGGATCVNLWHGVALKRIEFCIQNGPLADRFVRKTLKERFYYPQVYRRPDYLLSSSAFQAVTLAKSFRIHITQCINGGYPRNEILLTDETSRRRFIAKYEPSIILGVINKISSFHRTFIYMPTWRESQKDIFSGNFNLDVLNGLMQEKNELLILKPHPNTMVDVEKLSQYSNILLLDRRVDSYAVLPYTDVLITDYSSVLYDYILMENKDVILYLYDINEYVNNRDFNYPFHESVVGKELYSFDELAECIKNNDYKIDAKKRNFIREKFWDKNENNSFCKKILDAVTMCQKSANRQ
ncbi:MAG: CDP-glycerol glycerophosphotransferase family protein [Prevotellaceae bacterium]|jgi:CDP-glycerol glycerophosphotransferase (TagB/SpsB family)|nr:CDP-glycerol glycerophosphotransferase family protein [Prevotellaceae bacterium]